MSRLGLALALSLAATLIGAALGARGCSSDAPVVVPLPAEVEMDPRGPVLAVEPVSTEELVGRVLRVSDELAEAAAILEEARRID